MSVSIQIAALILIVKPIWQSYSSEVWGPSYRKIDDRQF